MVCDKLAKWLQPNYQFIASKTSHFNITETLDNRPDTDQSMVSTFVKAFSSVFTTDDDFSKGT